MYREWKKVATIPDFKHYQQPRGSNECFIACAAMIISCFNEAITPEGLKDLLGIGNVEGPGSALDLINDYYITMHKQSLFPAEDRGEGSDVLGIDERPIPRFDELIDTIVSHDTDNGRFLYTPFLCCVGDSSPGDEPDPNYEGGHWVIIAGAGVDANDNQLILVHDSELCGPILVPYDEQQYLRNVDCELYWESSTYCNLSI